MNEMKLIMENWNRFLIIENLDKLKQDPAMTQKFVQRLSQTTDKNELQGVLTALLKDPQIKGAAELIVDLEDEAKDRLNQPTEPGVPGPGSPAVQDEGVLQDFGIAAGAHAYVIAQSPIFQKIVKFGAPILALALMAKGLSLEGHADPDLVKGAIDLVQASSHAEVEDGLEIAFGLVDIVVEKQAEV